MLRRAAAIAIAAVGASGAAVPALAAEYRTTAEAPALLYDAPSTKARPQYVFGRDVPLEVLVSVEGWTKVRDLGGTIGWMANKSLAERRVLQVRVPAADVRANADDASPVVIRVAENVLLELAEPATSPSTTYAPGWVKVKHRDGATGYVRVSQVFGL
jgi:SH3-like domain-containing protein